MLQFTGVVEDRRMRSQYLDRMDIERERGITMKSQAVRIAFTALDDKTYILGLIDTPGHVDFTYEAARSLAACEGALRLVRAAQGTAAEAWASGQRSCSDVVPRPWPVAGRGRPAPRPGEDLPRGVRPLPPCGPLCPRRRGPSAFACARPDDVDQGLPRDPGDRGQLARATQGRRF